MALFSLLSPRGEAGGVAIFSFIVTVLVIVHVSNLLNHLAISDYWSIVILHDNVP